MLKATKYVILITIDSLRRDHLGCYGYSKNTSPNIDRLAEQSIVFDQAISNAPYTRASFKALMTSTYPFSYGGYHSLKKQVKLAELFKQSGYYTVAFPTIPVLSANSSYSVGFDYFKGLFDQPERKKNNLNTTIEKRLVKMSSYLNQRFDFNSSRLYKFFKRLYDSFNPFINLHMPHSRGSLITKEAISILDNNKDKHLFMWIHYTDVHMPYNPPTQFQDNHYKKISKREIIRLNRNLYSLAFDSMQEQEIMALDSTEVENLINLYDGEIRYVDEQIGSLLEYLKETQLLDDTLIIVTADHGEAFGEHGAFGHLGVNNHTHIYDELIRVPLIISHPHLNRRLIEDQVCLLDIAPTLLEMLNLPKIKQFRGKTLTPIINGEEKRKGIVISEASAYNKKKCSLPTEVIPADDVRVISCRTQDWKYILNGNGKAELYCLSQDPKEQNNLIDNEKELAREFKSKILSHIATQLSLNKEKVKDQVKGLKRLGKL